MNALWLKNICAYKSSSNSAKTAKIIIDFKIKRRKILLKRFGFEYEISSGSNFDSLQALLLYEARNAKKFWRGFKFFLPEWTKFPGRNPRSKDPVNTLLDIGYHNLANEVRKILEKYNIPPELGVIHSAKEASETPLVYDLMEMFRGDVVDEEVLHFLRLKKEPLKNLEQKDIGYFLSRLTKKLNKKYYLKNFKQCHTYKYYMGLQILKFIKAVNHKKVFKPITLPSRHDSRCARKKI